MRHGGLVELLFGRPLRSQEERSEELGLFSGIPVLGLDALSSASYGPEAALTVLMPLGAVAWSYFGPIILGIIVVLLAVYFSYLQTIAAYPDGGGSYTVAKENLGARPGVLAATSLCLDYVLNVAVGISAGVGAIVSVAPSLLHFTLPMCLGILALLMVVNLRGVRSAGKIFMAPTYLFLACVGGAVVVGAVKTALAHGHPQALVKLPGVAPAAAASVGWLVLRAFASGCTALTGVEAVSNAVPIFRKPGVPRARQTLTVIIVALAFLLAGVAFLCDSYHISATKPGQPGYESVLSQLLGATTGHGGFYYVSMFSILCVLTLSANTSFADFPRVCRLLALDEYLPKEFAHRGSRLVYNSGIIILTILAGILLMAFGGLTDRLIPLFAIGAFGAFTSSQLGMVARWRRERGPGFARSLIINAIGAAATAGTLVIIAVSKFTEGAWITLLAIPLIYWMFMSIHRHLEELEKEVQITGPMEFDGLATPVFVVPIKRLDRVARKGICTAMMMSPDVVVAQIQDEEMLTEDVKAKWEEWVTHPAQGAGLQAPRLMVVSSCYREFFKPFMKLVQRLADEFHGRPIAVLVPELVERHWYNFLVRHRATMLKEMLLVEGDPRIVVVNTPWYCHVHGRAKEKERAARHHRRRHVWHGKARVAGA